VPTRIWLGSWNLDSVNFPATDLQQWLNASNPPASACDIVVLGLQEAMNSNPGNVDVEALGTAARAFLPHHTWFTEHAMAGHTKTSDNCQSLAILCNPTGAGTVSMFQHNNQNVQWAFESFGSVARTDNFLRKVRKVINMAEKGKGGIVGQVRYNNRKFAFTTAHLDSFSNQERDNQLWQIQNKVTHLSPDVAFLMGDLNYRLNLPTTPTDRRIDNFASALYSPIGRQNMLQLDTLPKLGTLTQTWHYTFPQPRAVSNGVAGEVIFPTYKRKKLSPAPVNRLLSQGPQALADFKTSYGVGTEKSHDVVYVKESRANEIDIGWLDRVGFRTYGGIVPNFQVVAFGADHSLNVSDHVPIYMVVDVA
jgi:hypothetical protein